MNKQITPRVFGHIATQTLNNPNIRVFVYDKKDILANVTNKNLQDVFSQMYQSAGFRKGCYNINDIDFVICLIDTTTNQHISIQALREYEYTPGKGSNFLHVEYAMTIPGYEGKGLFSTLTKIILAFAVYRGLKGVSAFAISHGSQIGFTRLGFKTITPMKYILNMTQNEKDALQRRVSQEGWVLNSNREQYYQNKYNKLYRASIPTKLSTFSPNKTGKSNLNLSKTRLDTMRKTYQQQTAFIQEDYNQLTNQYYAEILKKYLPTEAKNYEWLASGMNIKGLCPNKSCCLIKTKYRPWMSHIFTFGTQSKKLRELTSNIMNGVQREKNKGKKKFTPKIKSTLKPQKGVKKVIKIKKIT